MENACTEDVKTFECEDCEITFSEKESLQKHKDEVCQKYKCDKCESAFPISELLEQHALVHSNEPNNLRREMQKIRENAIILCGICDKRFTNEVFVGIHQNKPGKCLPFKCDPCKKSFVTKTELESHKMMCPEEIKKIFHVL